MKTHKKEKTKGWRKTERQTRPTEGDKDTLRQTDRHKGEW